MSQAFLSSSPAFLIVASMLSIISSCSADEIERPFIWVKASDWPDILKKIENSPWANELFQTLKSRADEATGAAYMEKK